MIRKLRNHHRLAVIAMWILLPLLLATAILNREEIPRQEFAEEASVGNTTEPVFDGQLAEGDLVFHAHIFHGDDHDVLELTPQRVPLAPDILVYWLPAGQTRAQGSLLGTLGKGRATMDLPEAARAGGSLELYSLGWQRTLGKLVLPATGKAVP